MSFKIRLRRTMALGALAVLSTVATVQAAPVQVAPSQSAAARSDPLSVKIVCEANGVCHRPVARKRPAEARWVYSEDVFSGYDSGSGYYVAPSQHFRRFPFVWF